MILKTDYLGEVEIQEEDIYTFPEGLYGFPDSHKFVFLGVMTQEFPFLWMQSLDEERAVFIVTNPFLFKEEYDFELNDTIVNSLEIDGIEQSGIYSLVVIPEEVKEITINLKSPVILNLKTKKGKQVVLNEDYPFKYKIFQNGGESC